jgi:glycosyltransferase involved in cell wall biosynthesis
MAQGDFVQFLDADDILEKNKFELQLQLAEEHNVDIVVSGYDYLVDGKTFQGNKYSEIIPDCTLDGFMYGWDAAFVIVIHSPLISREFLSQHQIKFYENLKAKEDWFFWVTCALHNARFYYCPDILAHYRRHNRNITCNNSTLILANYKAVLYLYDLLNEEQKAGFKEKMPSALWKKTIIYYGKDFQNSNNYKVGKWILQPIRYLMQLLQLRRILRTFALFF